MTTSRPVATGVGSLPGTDPREALRVVLGELPDLPHLPELPARGPGADLVGRGASLLVELAVDLQPAGWRLVARPGRDARRAAALLAEDLDVLEELAAGVEGPLKVQAAGPWTLAASVELPRGGPVLGDAGARRDLAASLAEGVAAHAAAVRARLPRAEVVVQVDEPSLPAVLAGTVPTASGFATVPPIEPTEVEEALRAVLAAAGAPTVHCCAANAPVGLLRRSGAAGVGVDLTLAQDDEALAEALEAGLLLHAGVVAALEPRPGPDVAVERLRDVRRRLTLSTETLAGSVVLTPTCGLAGATPAGARAVMAAVREAAGRVRDDPDLLR